MDKITIEVPEQDGKWGSYISKYPADSNKVPNNAFSKDTRNIITSISGQAQKIQGGTLWNPASLLGHAPLDQYEAIFNSGTRILIFNDAGTLKGSSGNNTFTSIQAGFNSSANFEFATYQDRVYGDNGVDDPIVIDTATSYGGVSYSFTLAKTRSMGVQAPSSAPTVALAVDSTTPQVPAGAHTYKITFVYYNGVEESNGGPASTPVTNDATHTSNNLTAIPVGGYGVSARNIYRDNNNGNWLLLDTIANNTATTYTDRLVIGSTPTPIPTDNFSPPKFKYIANWLDRNFIAGVAGSPNLLFWSIAGQPDVFASENFIPCRNDDVITALYVFNGILYVFGQHSVGVILGNTDNTFYYSPISTTVGCVDNRSIAVRSLISVPTMIWLSALPNRGFYFSNGSAVQFMSEYIDDLALTVSQITFLERSNTQSSQADFEGDTSSDGIDLTSNPGSIQTINPKAFYGSSADWLTGTIVNLGLIGDQLKNILRFAPTAASGSIGGNTQISGSNLLLPTHTAAESASKNQDVINLRNNFSTNEYQLAQAIDPARFGSTTISTLTAYVSGVGGTSTYKVDIYNDALGTPGSSLWSSGNLSAPSNAVSQLVSFTPGLAVTNGVRYWVVITGNSATPTLVGTHNPQFPFAGLGSVGTYANSAGSPSVWVHQSGNGPAISYTTPGGADAGNWTSPVYDTLSAYVSGSGLHLDITGSYPSGCSSTVVVQGSNSLLGPFTVTDTLSSPNGTFTLAGGAYRFWQIIITLATSDNHVTPTVSVPVLRFAQTGTWTSPVISNSSDITTLDSLVATLIGVAGTSYTIYIRTSPTGVGSWTAYGPIGSAVPDDFSQLQLTMNTDSGDTVTDTASTVELDWTIDSVIESSAIDTAAVPPSGWGPFQYDSTGGGSPQAYFRSASTSMGLSSASYVMVANAQIPPTSNLEFCQWKFTFTSTADNFPVINSVTVNWFIGSGAASRCAAVFFNKSYYCAVATKGSAHNNLVIEYDQDGNWRIHSAFNIGTIGTYFNDLYYGSSTSGDVINAFKQDTENGTPIVFDLRGKCFNYGSNLNLKTVRSLKVTGVGTGTLIHAYYSIDRGENWIEMLNQAGTAGFQTVADGVEFVEYFVPTFDGSQQTGGRNIMYRIVSSDVYPCAILGMSPTVYKRKGKYLS